MELLFWMMKTCIDLFPFGLLPLFISAAFFLPLIYFSITEEGGYSRYKFIYTAHYEDRFYVYFSLFFILIMPFSLICLISSLIGLYSLFAGSSFLFISTVIYLFFWIYVVPVLDETEPPISYFFDYILSHVFIKTFVFINTVILASNILSLLFTSALKDHTVIPFLLSIGIGLFITVFIIRLVFHVAWKDNKEHINFIESREFIIGYIAYIYTALIMSLACALIYGCFKLEAASTDSYPFSFFLGSGNPLINTMVYITAYIASYFIWQYLYNEMLKATENIISRGKTSSQGRIKALEKEIETSESQHEIDAAKETIRGIKRGYNSLILFNKFKYNENYEQIKSIPDINDFIVSVEKSYIEEDKKKRESIKEIRKDEKRKDDATLEYIALLCYTITKPLLTSLYALARPTIIHYLTKETNRLLNDVSFIDCYFSSEEDEKKLD